VLYTVKGNYCHLYQFSVVCTFLCLAVWQTLPVNYIAINYFTFIYVGRPTQGTKSNQDVICIQIKAIMTYCGQNINNFCSNISIRKCYAIDTLYWLYVWHYLRTFMHCCLNDNKSMIKNATYNEAILRKLLCPWPACGFCYVPLFNVIRFHFQLALREFPAICIHTCTANSSIRRAYPYYSLNRYIVLPPVSQCMGRGTSWLLVSRPECHCTSWPTCTHLLNLTNEYVVCRRLCVDCGVLVSYVGALLSFSLNWPPVSFWFIL